MTRPGFLRCLLPIVALAGTAARTDAQSDPSPWRFGVTLGGGALLGVVAEYWSDDIGVEARLGTFAFEDVSVRLSPKWRVGAWDGGEASWRVGAQWVLAPGGSAFVGFHGVELAKVTDGGHVIGGSYNLPLFFGGSLLSEDSEDPEDPEGPDMSSFRTGTILSAALSIGMGEFAYRYQPNSGN